MRAVVDVVVDVAVVHGQERHALSGVHDAAAADGDDDVDAILAGNLRAFLCRGGQRIRRDLVVEHRGHALILQQPVHPIVQAGLLSRAAAGDDERLLAVLRGVIADRVHLAYAEHDIHGQMVIERRGGGQLRNGEKMAIGVGKLTKSLRCLYKSYHQAEAIMRIQTKQSMLDAGYIYSDMGAYRLLLGIEDSDIVADYLDQVLGPLIDYDTQKGSDFTKVLRVYLFNNGSVQETASQLYVHRNTVNYRINRASEILGMDLSNLEVRLQLMLCFLLLDMR